MKICSKQKGLVIKSQNPKFKYRFPEADTPVEVEDSHSEKILLNPTFYEQGVKETKKASVSAPKQAKTKDLNKKEATS